MKWPSNSEEFYWDLLLEHSMSRSPDEVDFGREALIYVMTVNLSQTPREQCEILGLSTNKGNLAHHSPGQSVIVHGLINQQQLNGCSGRVLPLTGQGSLATPPTAPRVAVRLTTMKTICCRPENIKYHAVEAAHAAPRNTSVAAASRSAAQPSTSKSRSTGAGLVSPTGRLADLVRADVLLGDMPLLVSRASLRRGFVSESDIRCSTCGDASQDGYMALAGNQSNSRRPGRPAMQLECVDCLIRRAQAAGVPADVASVGRFVES